MVKLPETIEPRVGLGPLRFGLSREQVEDLLGSPDERDTDSIVGWEIWTYSAFGIAITFEEEADNRCTNLWTENLRFRIGGEIILGQSVEALKRGGNGLGIGPFEFNIDPEVGDEFEWPEADVTVFCNGGVTERLSWDVEIDDDEFFDWPAPWLLDGAGLRGRPIESRDLQDLISLFSDSDVAATLGGVRSPEQVKSLHTRWCDAWEKSEHGLWIFEWEEVEQFLGYCGVAPAQAAGSTGFELLYAFRSEAWGRGIATRAARAVLTYAFSVVEFDHLMGYAMADNVGSRRVLERCGFSFERHGIHADVNHAFYRLTREAWLENRSNQMTRLRPV